MELEKMICGLALTMRARHAAVGASWTGFQASQRQLARLQNGAVMQVTLFDLFGECEVLTRITPQRGRFAHNVGEPLRSQSRGDRLRPQ
jgi:hypothetical protein